MFHTLSRHLANVVTAASALLITSGSTASFGTVDISTTSTDQILCSVSLENCYSEEIIHIIDSGQPIKFIMNFSLFDAEKGITDTLAHITEEHEIYYDLIDKKYSILLSESKNEYETDDRAQALSLMQRFVRCEINTAEEINRENKYFIVLTARIEGNFFKNDRKKRDLMKYWNNKIPTLRTSTFSPSQPTT